MLSRAAMREPPGEGALKIAYFGTGLLGSGFVHHLCELGHELSVWNRSAGKARALEADGARVCATPAEAVRGVDQLHLTLADDASVDAVLEPLAGVIDQATWIVDHTTTAPTPTADRVARWGTRGVRFVHAPVFMGPANARDASGLMLLSGESARYEALRATLESMTGRLVYLGEAPGRAAAFKLFGNLVIIAMIGALGDVNRLAAGVGIPTAEALGLFAQFNPGQLLSGRAAKIAAGDFSPPSFELTMARKDVRLMLEEAKRHGVDLLVMPGVAAMLDAAIARGDGALDMGAMAKA
jgi:3-hydroxyisobutyrate dehydrogenase